MILTKNIKHLIAALTFINLFAGIAGLLWFFTTVFPVIIKGNAEVVANTFILSAPILFAAIIVVGVLSTGLLVFYLVHAAMNNRLGTGMKVVWILLILFLKPIAEVVYLFMEIYPVESNSNQDYRQPATV